MDNSTNGFGFNEQFATGFVLAHIPFFLAIALIVYLCCYCYKRKKKRRSVTKDPLSEKPDSDVPQDSTKSPKDPEGQDSQELEIKKVGTLSVLDSV